MFDLNSTLFFKSKFTMELLSPENSDLLWLLILKIKGWMVPKWRRCNEEIPTQPNEWTKWKLGSFFESANGTVKFKSLHFLDADENHFWAGKIIESRPPENGCAPREWVTEIGFQPRSASVADVCIVIYYSDRPGFIGPCEPAPQASTPRLIRMLCEDPQLRCTIGDYPVRLEPIRLRPGDFPEFWHSVCDENRDVPIVYLSPRAGEQPGAPARPLIDPVQLANILGPNALVYYADDVDFSREMTQMCHPDSMGCYSGAIRIYTTHPAVENEGDSYRHRRIPARDIIGAEEAVQDILRRALAQDVHFYEKMFRIEDCQRLIDRRRAEQHKQAYKKELEDLLLSEADAKEALLQKRLEEIDDERFQWEITKDDYEQQLSNLRKELRSTQAYADSLREEATLSATRAEALDAVRDIASYPQSPRAIAEYFEKHFADRIAFSDRGKASLDSCETDPKVLWDALYQMSTLLFELYEDDNVSVIEKSFNNANSKLRIVRGEGSMTRKDANLMRQYTDTYKGKTISIETHLKTNQPKESSPQFLRIYYAYDSALHKIIIGSCGKHLDNYSTQKIK